MINYLKGTIIRKTPRFLIVENNGIGYRVYIKSIEYEGFPVGKELELYIHENVKEDALDLYGFQTFSELEMFELLLSVSGVGPKAGMSILSLAHVEQLCQAISSEDSSLLTRVSGIGKKTAERIILELKNKVGAFISARDETKDIAALSSDLDTVEALAALGYSKHDVREALINIDKTLDTKEKIRQALRIMGK